LAVTLRSCLRQAGVGNVVVVDDGSPEHVRPSIEDTRLKIIRLEKNSGISVARNQGIAATASPYVAFVNSDIELENGWLAATSKVLDDHPSCGAAFTAARLTNPTKWLTRWRTAYQEMPPPLTDGPARFAPGHAVLFRRSALEEVGGYDPRWVRAHEDVDVCDRLRNAGWNTRYTSRSGCLSRQIDDLWLLGRKEAVRELRCTNDRIPLQAGCWIVFRRGCGRFASSVLHRRWLALAAEPFIMMVAFWEAVKIGTRPGTTE
jgi:cellulose synthase/poly-beta-1,6-N-acetylglucosamine synthase-like glycosyltransferase